MKLFKVLLKRKSIIVILILLFISAILWLILNGAKDDAKYATDISTLQNGKNIFDKNCVSCHALEDDGIGPSLGGITSILSKQELISFVQNPSNVIASGNKRANYLFNRYNNIMPSFAYLQVDELENIFAFIDNESIKNDLIPQDINLKKPINKDKRYAKPVEFDGLVINLEDYIKVPLAPNRISKKGIATLRTTPALKNTIFVSDQMGKIYITQNNKTSLFLDVASNFKDFIFEPGHGTGVGSFAIHPNFNNNGLFYTTHAEKYLGKKAINKNSIPDSVGVWVQWVIIEWKANNIKDLVFKGNKREVLRINPLTHAHGVQDIGFDPTIIANHPDYGLLYVGVGDGGASNRKHPELATQKNTPLGAILRIDPLGINSTNGHYGIPKNNPFYAEKDTTIQKEIFAFGFRNPHRFCWDHATGKMIASDVGEANVEEINIIKSGKNYGWSFLEGAYGIDMKKDSKTLFTASPEILAKYELPFAAYDHKDGHAISGGYVYNGTIGALKNKYIFGDIASGRLFYINIDNNFQDNTIYELKIYNNNEETTIRKLTDTRNTNLRIGYDENENKMFLMTKNDGIIRCIVDAYYLDKNDNIE